MLVNGRRLVGLLVAEHLQSGVPGTGKTKVIGAAVSHLLAQGKSVCRFKHECCRRPINS